MTGSATVFGDIPPSDAVRDAWQDWNTDRRRAAVKAVLSQVTVSPDTRGGREPATGRFGWRRCASGRNSTGGSDEQQPSKVIADLASSHRPAVFEAPGSLVSGTWRRCAAPIGRWLER